MSDVLKDAGYQTGYIGKWHLDLSEKNLSESPESGADGWDAFTPPGPKRHGFDFWYSYGAWDQHLSPHYWQDTPEKMKVNQWSVEHETDVALDFIKRRNPEEPFALFVSWNPPHTPYEQVPEKYKEMYENLNEPFRENVNADTFKVHTGEEIRGGLEELAEKRKNYFAAVTGIDENFGRILAALKEEQLEEDTIVVLTADHGELMGSHGLMTKHVWYEESIGVPFAIRWPGQVVPQTTDALLNTVDIMPTLLQMAGLHVPDTVEGIDLTPVLKGEDDEQEAVFLCAYPGRVPAIEKFEKAQLDHLAYGWRAVRTKNHLYAVHRGYVPGEPTVRLLHDLKNDPYQLQPVEISDATSEETAKALEDQLLHWLTEQNDPIRHELRNVKA
ncbi:sulfatase family protein [Litoribacterium kuwaitense]|uniref:sulfatase family protein n=1 Tax=Litoribacterium kuwaitense TaxID=1398745 RepID=UPI002483DE2E|nr:sulfatase [Litoribacterium kuwaitense]